MLKHGSKNSDEAMIIKEINKIKVTKPIVLGILVENPAELPVIILEEKRVVIGIDDKRCAVFLRKKKKLKRVSSSSKGCCKRNNSIYLRKEREICGHGVHSRPYYS